MGEGAFDSVMKQSTSRDYRVSCIIVRIISKGQPKKKKLILNQPFYFLLPVSLYFVSFFSTRHTMDDY